MTDAATKHGSFWSDDEIAIVVAEYFLMLAAEISGRPYVKAEHRRRVMQHTGRAKGAVEYKFENISAVLEELGVPWVWGYKPASNYQNALADAVGKYLLQNFRDLALVDQAVLPPRKSATNAEADVFVSPPEPSTRDRLARKPAMRELVNTFDPAARDERNRALGRAGEQFVLDYERRRLELAGKPKLAEKVEWISQDKGDGYGYDILSFTPEGREQLIEVKTTYGHERTPFWITRRECEVAAENREIFRLRRVFHFGTEPKMFELQPPLEQHVALYPSCFIASFSRDRI